MSSTACLEVETVEQCFSKTGLWTIYGPTNFFIWSVEFLKLSLFKFKGRREIILIQNDVNIVKN